LSYFLFMGILSKLKFFSKPQEVKSLSIPSRPAKVRNFVSETKGVSEKMKGSPFPSPEADKLMNQTAFLPTDWQQRLQDYILVETFFDNDVVAAEAVEMLCRGAVGNKGYTFMAKPIDDSPEAKFYAEETNRICGDIQRRQLDAEKVGDCAVELGKLSNLPIQLVWKGKEIDEIIPMAPYGFRINTDERNQFYDKKACYIQYDTAIPSAQKPLASFSQKEMVFATYKKRPWERYGRLVALKVAKECESIIKGIEYISDGRASAMPETNYIASWGDAKNMLTDEQMKEFQSTLNKPIVDTEKGNPYRRRVLNGQVDVKYVTTGTDYFSNVTDLDFHASRISAAWRVAYALIIFSNRISQQALLQLTENLYEAQSVFAAILDRQIIMPIFKLALEEQGVDVSKISIEFIWHQRKLPSRLTAEAIRENSTA
jgi:hypothetical protein